MILQNLRGLENLVSSVMASQVMAFSVTVFKCSQEVRLQDSLTINISRKSQVLS